MENSFTRTSVVFAATGHFIVGSSAQPNYIERARLEIDNGLVYQQVMSEIPRNLLASFNEYDDGTYDVDPIVGKYLLESYPDLQMLDQTLKSHKYQEALEAISQTFPNDTMSIEPIKFLQFMEYLGALQDNIKEKTI